MASINTAFQVPLPYQTMPEYNGEGVAGSFITAYQMAQQRNDPLYKLKAAQIDQEMRARSIEIQNAMTQRENSLQAMQGVAKLSELTGEIASNGLWDDPAAKGAFWDMVRRYPAAASTPQFREVLGQFEIARKASEEKEKMDLEKSVATSQIEANRAHANYWKSASAKAERVTESVEPQVKVIEGKKFLVNPKTGAVHEVSKTVSKSQFINQHVSQWMKEQMIDEKEAAQRLGTFYDQNIAEQPATPTAAPMGAPQATRFVLDPGTGKLVPKK